ncbi:MAG: ABC transporter ATP-binding protein [Paracoccaceae bacterium]|nr:ABC transporter ATP-binding protein [Paracoccaceae bacterium]
MNTPAIDIQAASKFQGKRQTVCDVTLKIAAGERVALLGHNGAGKTTLIRMVLGLTRIDGGTITVDGAVPGSAHARRVSAFLPESVSFHKALTGREQLLLFARLNGQPVSVVAPLLERVGLADAADRKIGAWSKGMRQRLGLAQVLLGNPKVALLDEPTSGLDPISRREFYGIVDELADGGTAVLVSSHALTELEARTDRIAILRAGNLVADSSLADLRTEAKLPIRVRVTTEADQADGIALRLGGQRVNCRGVELTCDQTDKMRRLGDVTALGALIDDVEVIPPSLEDLYRFYSTKGDGK